VFAVVRLKRMVIDRALAIYDEVDVWRKWGNHGRIGKFGDLPDTDNLDLMADTIAAEAYRDNPRVRWRWDNYEYIQQFEIGNYRAALLHGNEFYRSFSAARVVNKVTAWQTQHDFGDVYMGHFHRSDVYGLPNGARVYMTGSPESSNSYAADMLAVSSKPSQRVHFIDPEAGRVQAEHVIWLT
jgi:predicted phosphodiesterase